MIYPVGFYKTKARRIKDISKTLLEKYNGKVPDDFNELLTSERSREKNRKHRHGLWP